MMPLAKVKALILVRFQLWHCPDGAAEIKWLLISFDLLNTNAHSRNTPAVTRAPMFTPHVNVSTMHLPSGIEDFLNLT